jgi:hypothetical protein
MIEDHRSSVAQRFSAAKAHAGLKKPCATLGLIKRGAVLAEVETAMTRAQTMWAI